MRQLQDNIAEILIVGAGPTGLMMACQLAIHQIPFRIIDKSESSSKSSGALIVQARSLEIFEQMGIAQEALKGGIIANKVNLFFNGKKLTSTDIKDIGGNLSKFPYLLMHEQSKTEKLLLKFINSHGHYVERGIRFKSLLQDKEGVISVLVLPDESEQFIRTKYVIAADGANSTIRNFLNIPFKGKTYPNPIFILDCKAETEIVHNEICIAFSKSSVAGIFPLPGNRWRIDSTLPEEAEILENITFDNIEKDFHLWTKMNITFMDKEWFSISHAHQKYATSINVQNCFLLGDAAHINSPVGAQGMNTGLQDAYNLAWKLAFVIKHKAKPELLVTYSTERLGISKGFAHYADTIFKLVTSKNVAVKFFRIYILKELLKVLFPLMEKRRTVRQMFFKSISQIDIHYRHSILSYKASEGHFSRTTPKPGDRFPYIDFYLMARKTNTYDNLDVADFNLVVLSNVLSDEINKISKKYNLAVIIIAYLPETKKLYESLGIKNKGYYLIRPDMHIALRSATLNIFHLNNYLERFLLVNS